MNSRIISLDAVERNTEIMNGKPVQSYGLDLHLFLKVFFYEMHLFISAEAVGKCFADILELDKNLWKH